MWTDTANRVTDDFMLIGILPLCSRNPLLKMAVSRVTRRTKTQHHPMNCARIWLRNSCECG